MMKRKMKKTKKKMIQSFFNKLCFLFILSVFFSQLGWSAKFKWSADSSYLRKNYSQVRNFENYIFSIPDQSEELVHPEIHRTFSTIIIKNNHIIYEKYSNGHDKNRAQKLWSISKSITNLLIGIAVREKKLKLSNNICSFFKDYIMNFNCTKMKVKDLLSWSSGIHWRELFSNPLKSSVFNLLYNEFGYKDSTSFILKHPLIRSPGESWHYSSSDTNLLMSILSKIHSEKEYISLPWDKLFNKIGIESAVWDTDSKGVFNGCCSLYMTSRDLARIGLLILNRGKWGEERILSEDWIEKYVFSVSPSFFKEPILILEQFVPGYHWWVNKPSNHNNVHKPRALPDAPEDLVAAVGYAGQFLFIIPSENMIIVRTGDSPDYYLDMNAMIAMAIGITKNTSYSRPIRTKPVPYSLGVEYEAPLKYTENTFKSLNNFIAKEMCYCVFIEKETEKICMENLKYKFKNLPSIFISKKRNYVKTSSFKLFFPSKATFKNRHGCQLN